MEDRHLFFAIGVFSALLLVGLVKCAIYSMRAASRAGKYPPGLCERTITPFSDLCVCSGSDAHRIVAQGARGSRPRSDSPAGTAIILSCGNPCLLFRVFVPANLLCCM